MNLLRLGYGFVATWIAVSTAHAATICTVIADGQTGNLFLQQGDCNTRVTPASTFKIALSLMGYDSGFLKDEHTPILPYMPGDVDWGGPAWREPTDPTRWIEFSVVWFSQRVTHDLGVARLHRYASAFAYGNADFSGDPGKNNGLDRAWVGSSLKISPVEQVTFVLKLLKRQLPVSEHAFDMTNRITDLPPLPSGWNVHGKTGTAYPRDPSGVSDLTHGLGWFVGWATKAGRTVVLVRLTQDEKKEQSPAGVRTRDTLLAELPTLVEPEAH